MFWNLNKNPNINQVLFQLIIEKNPDIVVLAEYSDDAIGLLKELNNSGLGYRELYTAGSLRITMFSSISDVEPSEMNGHYAMQIINKDLLLCGLHLTSNLHDGDGERRRITINIIKQQIQILKSDGIKDVIIVGDFNDNPYDKNVVGFEGFNGNPDSVLVKEKKVRTIENEKNDYYYNPMWNLFGDFADPLGTCWFSERVNKPSWNMYDQVLISSSLVKAFCKESLEIITEIGDKKLKNKNGKPNKSIYSDHFPIIFEIKER